MRCSALRAVWALLLPGRITALQILVEGLPADPKLPGDFCLANACRNARAQLRDRLSGEGLLASSVGTSLFGQDDPFSLALLDQRPRTRQRPPLRHRQLEPHSTLILKFRSQPRPSKLTLMSRPPVLTQIIGVGARHLCWPPSQPAGGIGCCAV